jgi:polyhydroxyalkanoate synthesis regulator phasin
MSEQANIVEQGRERIQGVFQSVEDEFTKIQKQVEDRRSEFNDSAEKRLKKLQSQLRKYPAYKRAETLGNDVSKQIEEGTKQIEVSVESTLESGLSYLRSAFRIASRDEVHKLEKKLDRVSRRISSLDKAVNQSPAGHGQ